MNRYEGQGQVITPHRFCGVESVGCNYESLSLIPAAGTHVLNWRTYAMHYTNISNVKQYVNTLWFSQPRHDNLHYSSRQETRWPYKDGRSSSFCGSESRSLRCCVAEAGHSVISGAEVAPPSVLIRPFVFGSLCSFFHFIRRFWNQILICRSVRHSACAISILRLRVRYRLKWNSFSSSSIWCLV